MGQYFKKRTGVKKKKMSCRKCGAEGGICASRQRAGDYICSKCSNRQRDSDPFRYMARKFADWLRRRGFRGPFPGVAFVRAVVAQYKGCSVISGETKSLCIVLVDESAEWTLENAVLVTSDESRFLSTCHDKRRLIALMRT